MDRRDVVTFGGNPVTLTGNVVNVGDAAPDFTVTGNDMKPVSSGSLKGKIRIISVAPSLDTPVCSMQATKFNSEAAGLSDDIVIVNITVDLPFAISRFCTAAGIDRIKTYSDHKDLSFGLNYGVVIKELRLLARSIFIIGRDDRIAYIEYVKDVTNHPDYDRAVSEAKKLL